jgi:hypothetical protein
MALINIINMPITGENTARIESPTTVQKLPGAMGNFVMAEELYFKEIIFI